MKIEVYQALNTWFYWRLRARNGRIVADGSEGYVNRSNARRAARRVENAIKDEPYQLEIKHL